MRLIIELAPGEVIEEAYEYYNSLKEDNIANDKTAIKFQGYTSLPGIYKDFDEYWQSMKTIIHNGNNKQEIFASLPKGVDPYVMLDNLMLLNEGLEKNYGQTINFDEAKEFAENAYKEGLKSSGKSK